MSTYAVVRDDAGPDFSAYVPDLAGCVAAGSSIEDVAENIHDTIAPHSEMMNEQGEDVSVLSSQVIRVDVAS